MVRMPESCAHPALPPPHPRAPRRCGARLREFPPVPPFAREGGHLAPPGLEDLTRCLLLASFCSPTAVPLQVAPQRARDPRLRERPRGAGARTEGGASDRTRPCRREVEVKVGKRGLQSSPAPVVLRSTKKGGENDIPICLCLKTLRPALLAATASRSEAEDVGNLDATRGGRGCVCGRDPSPLSVLCATMRLASVPIGPGN